MYVHGQLSRCDIASAIGRKESSHGRERSHSSGTNVISCCMATCEVLKCIEISDRPEKGLGEGFRMHRVDGLSSIGYTGTRDWNEDTKKLAP